jgi:hypothetical protein
VRIGLWLPPALHTTAPGVRLDLIGGSY